MRCLPGRLGSETIIRNRRDCVRKKSAFRDCFDANWAPEQSDVATKRGTVKIFRIDRVRVRRRERVRVSLKFINLTRRTEIGANSYYLETAGHRLVLDSGMHPKFAGEDALPNLNALRGRKLDAIIVSHSHQDHIGTLPVLMRRQPQARVFMTEPTAEIGSTLLHNSVNVMTRQREELGPAVTGIYPLFTHRETDRVSERWQSCALRQTYT